MKKKAGKCAVGFDWNFNFHNLKNYFFIIEYVVSFLSDPSLSEIHSQPPFTPLPPLSPPTYSISLITPNNCFSCWFNFLWARIFLGHTIDIKINPFIISNSNRCVGCHRKLILLFSFHSPAQFTTKRNLINCFFRSPTDEKIKSGNLTLSFGILKKNSGVVCVSIYNFT